VKQHIGLFLWFACAGFVPAAALQPAPVLDPPPPLALKVGQAIDLTLHGRHLGSLSTVDAQGLGATIVRPEKPADDSVVVRLVAPQTVAPGERLLRLLGPAGVTSPITVFVSQYDVAASTPLLQSVELMLPVTLTGVIDTPGLTHAFKFHGTRGEQLIFDIHATRLGSSLEALATIHGDDGHELRWAVEHHGRDPLLVFDPPRDGSYVLRVRDLRYRGGAQFGYRITAGHIPYLEGLLPGSGKPGTIVKARPVGHNLQDARPVTIDLTSTAPGRIMVRAATPQGLSNEVPFEVTELPQITESEPNNSPAEANTVQVPVEISAELDAPADDDFFRFHVAYKQAVSLEVLAGRYGSPVAPLLELRNNKGEVIESNDGTPDADARIMRELDAGDYLASVRDLGYSGGPGYWYRLKIEPGQALRQDFSVRFLPETLRLHRGGNVAVWLDVRRLNGFRGDISIVADQLPNGVSVVPLTLPDNASGWITLSASPQAKLGSTPIRLRAQGTAGAVPVAHDVAPAAPGGGYLTVLDEAPIGIQTVANLSPLQTDQINGEIQSLTRAIANPGPQLAAAQAQWEQKLPKEPVWTHLEAKFVESNKGTKLLRQSDSSVLAYGPFPPQDQYTIVTRPGLRHVTAIRLEALADDRLPARGPGAAPNGNFVLSEFNAFASKDNGQRQPITLQNATADFSQPQFPVAAAIDGNTDTGWAIDNQEGHDHVAVFQLASPLDLSPNTTLTCVLHQVSQFPQHNIGRFRISISDAPASVIGNVAGIPEEILKIAMTPPDQCSAAQKTLIAGYYRTIDPQAVEMRNRLEALRQFIAPYAEMRRLQLALTTTNPQLEAEQTAWEQRIATGAGWSVINLTSTSGLSRQPDGSMFAGSGNGNDTYRLMATTPLKGITALRLELLPDPRLPANGPGRADDGSFLLSGFHVTTRSKDSQTDVAFKGVSATRELKDFPASTLLSAGGAGWSAGPGSGLPMEITFYPDKPVTADSLDIGIDQVAPKALGRFRIWATTNPEPDKATALTASVSALLAVASPMRSAGQKRQLAEYFRSIAPSLNPVRQRLTELRASLPAVPVVTRRNQITATPLLLTRRDGFKGDVAVTLEGFVSDPTGSRPPSIAKQIKVQPLTLAGDAEFGLLTLLPDRTADLGTRVVVVKAVTKMGDETITEYSPAFGLTIGN
jgi:hypothetical protein